MQMKELYRPKDWALIERFRSLPNREKEKIQDKAGKLIEEICRSFPKIVMDANGFDLRIKRSVVECLFGPVDQTEKEAMREGSKFDRFYHLAFVAAVIEVMKDHNDQKTLKLKKDKQKNCN